MKGFSFLTHFTLLLGCVLITHSEVNEIDTAKQLIELFNKGSGDVDAEIYLNADLNFSGAILPYPLGASSEGEKRTFTGVLHGNGHSITDLVMNNMESQGYSSAGLFASVSGATIENLVIDASCSFSGSSAGALGVAAKGSLIMRNVINNANVIGQQDVGGFIGSAAYYFSHSLEFDQCINAGNITATAMNVGGFIGSVSSVTDIEVTITNSENNGIVSGGTSGGFVGRMNDNRYLNIMFSNTTNNGIISSESMNVGGFIGGFQGNTHVVMNTFNTTNNGNVNSTGAYSGGFVGHIAQNENLTIVVSNHINNGNVTVDSFTGKFAGVFLNNDNVDVTISDSVFNGNVDGSNCGGIIGYLKENKNITMTISNTIVNGNLTRSTYRACQNYWDDFS